MTHDFIGYFVELNENNFCRLAIIEPLIARTVHIKKDRTLTEKSVVILLTDAIELSIQRPKKEQKQALLFRCKNLHTQKKEMTLTRAGKIIDT